MIITTRAACAAPLERLAKQCSRCKTRYCKAACQREHWNAGGHKDLCKKIKKGGGAEQYHADKKYKEAVAVAVEEFADDMAYCDRAGLSEAEATLADVAQKFRRLLGPSHPDTKVAEASAAMARLRIRGLFGGAAPEVD